jgi:RHS repeat-associated protein
VASSAPSRPHTFANCANVWATRGTTSYYQQDGLGSVTSLSNTTGPLANTYAYDSYGKLVVATGTLTNPLQYTGREFDAETGLQFNRARYFDPGIGRFISEDPVRFRGGADFYAYVLNRPLRYRDVLGLQSEVAGCAYEIDCIHSPAERAQMQHDHDERMNWIFHPDPSSPLPVPDPIPNEISSAFDAYQNCVGPAPLAKCEYPGVPRVTGPQYGSGGSPGPADFGVGPNEGEPNLGNLSLDLALNVVKNCLRAFPLAVYDSRYQPLIEPGEAYPVPWWFF